MASVIANEELTSRMFVPSILDQLLSDTGSGSAMVVDRQDQERDGIERTESASGQSRFRFPRLEKFSAQVLTFAPPPPSPLPLSLALA